MLNFSDVATLRKQGMSNLDILKTMGTVVPSAQRSYDSLLSNQSIPAWQRETLVGKMLDQKVPRTAPSGLGYVTAMGLNKAQEKYDNVTATITQNANQPQEQKYDNPGWFKFVEQAVGNTARSLFESAIAPGEILGGIGAYLGRKASGKDTQPALQKMSKDAVTVLNSMPLYFGAVGAGLGMPGIGTAAGQAVTEAGHDIMGDNPATLAQQVADVGLAGIQGKLLGSARLGGPTNVPSMLLKGAGGQALSEGGRYLMGNNQESLGQAAQNIIGAGLVTAGLTAGFNVAVPTVQGVAHGLKTGLGSAIIQGAKGTAQGIGNVKGQFSPMRFIHRTNVTPNVDSFIQQKWDTAVRPGTGVKRTNAQMIDYNKNVSLAVKEIAANKQFLKLTTMEGEPIATEIVNGQTVNKAALPTSLWTASQANAQMMDKVFTSWDTLKKLTSGKGVTIPSDPIAQVLDGIASDAVMRAQYPNTAAFAENMASRLREQVPQLTLEQAQQMSQQWNTELQGYRRNAQPNDISNSTAIAAANNVLKKTLAEAIESETNSPVYSELKRSYAAQKAIEADLNRRLAVFSRQNPKALIDYTDIFSARDALRALTTLNPSYMASAAGIFAIKNWIKFLNNPDNMIKSMFQSADQHISDLGTPILQRAQEAIRNVPPQPQKSVPLSSPTEIPSSPVNLPKALPATEPRAASNVQDVSAMRETVRQQALDPVYKKIRESGHVAKKLLTEILEPDIAMRKELADAMGPDYQRGVRTAKIIAEFDRKKAFDFEGVDIGTLDPPGARALLRRAYEHHSQKGNPIARQLDEYVNGSQRHSLEGMDDLESFESGLSETLNAEAYPDVSMLSALDRAVSRGEFTLDEIIDGKRGTLAEYMSDYEASLDLRQEIANTTRKARARAKIGEVPQGADSGAEAGKGIESPTTIPPEAPQMPVGASETPQATKLPSEIEAGGGDGVVNMPNPTEYKIVHRGEGYKYNVMGRKQNGKWDLMTSFDNEKAAQEWMSQFQPSPLPTGGKGIPTGGGQTTGDFGPIHSNLTVDQAVAKLLKEKTGEAMGVVKHPEIGSIDLVYGKTGKDGYGLAKIQSEHPEVIPNLSDLLQNGKVVGGREGRTYMETADGKAVISLDWYGKEKKWVVTAYNKNPELGLVSQPSERRIGDSPIDSSARKESIISPTAKVNKSPKKK